MPLISLSEIVANKRTVAVDLGLPPQPDGKPNDLNVTYRVNVVTPADQMRMSKLDGDPNGQLNGFIDFLPRLIESWDLAGPLNDADGVELVTAGAPVPVTREMLTALPVTILSKVSRACLSDLNDPKSSTNSGGK